MPFHSSQLLLLHEVSSSILHLDILLYVLALEDAFLPRYRTSLNTTYTIVLIHHLPDFQHFRDIDFHQQKLVL